MFRYANSVNRTKLTRLFLNRNALNLP